MRKNITAAAIAMVIASGVSFAAFGDAPEKQEGSQPQMMGDGMKMDMNMMNMMGEMKEMMSECREMMDSMKESQANSSEKTGAPEA